MRTDVAPRLESCIYCGASFDATRSEGDHVIPSALGEFEGDRRFYQVCPECNGQIGRSEQVMLQCGPERIFRDLIRLAAPRTRRKRGRSHVGASGSPAPTTLAFVDGTPLLVRTSRDESGTVEPVDQIVITRCDGETSHVRLYAGMSAETLRERVTQEAPAGFHALQIHCGDGTRKKFEDLVAEGWPHLKFQDLPDTPAGSRQVTCRHEFTYDDRYFRAIAKIAFHYFLLNTQRNLRGDEEQFGPIRAFILDGGDVTRFFSANELRFDTGCANLSSGAAITTNHWTHFLAVDESLDYSRRIVAHVQLFVGPKIVMLQYRVALCQGGGEIVIHNACCAHYYEYSVPQPEKGFAGKVHRASTLICGPAGV